jgi:SAM-dependent methyltransferase
MCTKGVKSFVADHLRDEDVRDKRVLEVGSYDYNGSSRSDIVRFQPSSYLGVDIQQGPGVDEVADICDLTQRFGAEAFDVVVTTEVLEHVDNWRGALANLKAVLAPGGLLVLTTRSRGFRYHAAPYDFWRYEQDDMKVLFADLDIEALESDDSSHPGVFIRARKPLLARPLTVPLEAYALFSIILNRRALKVPAIAKLAPKLLVPAWHGIKGFLPANVAGAVKRWSGTDTSSSTTSMDSSQ